MEVWPLPLCKDPMLDIVMQVKIYGGRWEKGQLEQQVGCRLSSTLQIVVWNVLTPVEVIAPGLYMYFQFDLKCT
jgi:hypothetical protein